MHELAGWASSLMCNITNGHMEMEQAPFTLAISRYYLAILSAEYDLSKKLDLKAVAMAAS